MIFLNFPFGGIFVWIWIRSQEGILKVWGSESDPQVPPFLVGGFNPFQKYESNWIISPNRDDNKVIHG